MSIDLRDTQCSVCGCYCFSAPTPYPWKIRKTPSGKIKLCGLCDNKFANVSDPVKEYRIRRISARLAKARRAADLVERLEEELDELTA